MARTVVIPSDSSWWTCWVNGREYCYPGGSTQSVPDEVAEIILGTKSFPVNAPAPVDPWTPDSMVTKADLAAYAKSTDVMPAAASINGYDANKTQTLTNDKGTLKWVDVPDGE